MLSILHRQYQPSTDHILLSNCLLSADTVCVQCEPRLSVATALKALLGIREYVHTAGALQSTAATYNMLLCQSRAKSFWMDAIFWQVEGSQH
jgi:hypothetical protein